MITSSRNFVWQVSALSLLFCLYSAFVGLGFYHPDEHFQIIEIANYKLGGLPYSDTPWEFKEHLRPMFQPFSFFVLVKGLQAVGMTSHYTIALTFRVITSLLYACSILAMLTLIPHFIVDKHLQKISQFWTALYWLIPTMAAHPTSETWGSAFFILGFFSLYQSLQKTRNGHALIFASLAGLFFLLAFEARFQMGIAIFGLCLWVLLFQRHPRRLALLTLTTATFFLFLGIFAYVDRWGYGFFCFPPWDYFRVGIVEDIPSVRFGTHSAWYYVNLLLWQGLPLGPLFLLAFPLVWIFNFKSLLTGSTLFFYLVHFFALAHKEDRFLFPLAICAPAILFLSFETLKNRFGFTLNFEGKRLSQIGIAAIILNFIFLIFAPHRFGLKEINIYQYLYDRRIQHLLISMPRPYQPPNAFWYLPPSLASVDVSNLDSISKMKNLESPYYILLKGVDLSSDVSKLSNSCQVAAQSFPRWFSDKRFAWLRKKTRVTDMRLLKCTLQKTPEGIPLFQN